MFSQFNNDFLFYSNYKRSVTVNSEYEVNSTAINNSFIDKFYTGGHIDSTMKKNVVSKLTGLNRIGGNITFNTVAYFGKDSSKYRFMVGLKQHELFNSTFSSDFFKLGFYGNKDYAGKTANLSNTSINFYTYQEVKVGMIWDNIDTTGATMGISLSYLKGQNLMRLNTNNTSVYTASDASSIVLTTNASLALSDTTNHKLNAFNGNGLSAEFFAEMPYKSRLGKSKFFVSVNNLGFIRWSNKTLNFNADSTYTWSGVKIKSIFDLKDSSIKTVSANNIINKSTESSKRYVSTNLPTSLLIIHKIEFTNYFT
ncbi:MAG TPA: DUF5723 family protein, partial [Nitrosopumilaceae archaeon]|nr:DUF5723 family protein [Nitrosopumilaceae archaeon]